jgi:uncharacterized membrane protein (TIGR02234 family)
VTRRGSFGPVLLLGLGSAALAAVAGNKPWTEAYTAGGDCGNYPADLSVLDLAKDAPLAGALGLVVLSIWGVLLVTRGPVRRVMAGLAALGSVGFLAAAWDARTSLKAAVLDDVVERFGQPPVGCQAASVHMNDWWPAALAAGLVGVVAALVAVVLAPHWPEMGSKYDAPSAGGTPAAAPLEEQSSTDLWKALDAGHDPTLDSGTGPDDHDGPRA